MIKMSYVSKNYNYEDIGKQPYDLETTINIIEDASISEVLMAVIKMLEIAGYSFNRNLLKVCVDNAFDAKER